MKKFKFRLERVLEHRHSLTKESERELAIKNGQLHEAEEGMEMILGEQDSAKGFTEGVMTMAELKVMGDYLEALQRSLIEQRIVVEEATKAVEEARQAYLEKAIEEKTLIKLKDKKLEKFKEDLRKTEAKTQDGMVVQRYRFKK